MSATAAHVQVLAERREMAEWLVAVGYPCEWRNDEFPLPEPWRQALAEAWFRYEGSEITKGDRVADYVDWLAQEGGWS